MPETKNAVSSICEDRNRRSYSPFYTPNFVKSYMGVMEQSAKIFKTNNINLILTIPIGNSFLDAYMKLKLQYFYILCTE